MALNTTRLALTYPQPADSNNVPSDIQRLAGQLDLLCVAFVRDVAANRPASVAPVGVVGQGNYNPGTQGRWFWATDTGALSYDYGGGWYPITSALNLITSKGDLVVGTGASAAARLGAGGDGQALVARSGATLGVDWENTFGQPLGLPGAAQATRYVGATNTNGPPSSGTFNAGDWAVAQGNSSMWVCRTGGTPGTWIEVGSQQPMFAADVSSGFVSTGIYTVILGWSATLDTHQAIAGSGYVIPKPGVWLFSYQVTFEANSVGRRYARLVVNGDPAGGHAHVYSAVTSGVAGGSSLQGAGQTLVYPWYLNTGDLVGVMGAQDSGIGLHLVGYPDTGTTFSGHWLHS